MRVKGWFKYLMAFIVAMLFCPNTTDEVLQTSLFTENQPSVLIADNNFVNPISDSDIGLPAELHLIAPSDLINNINANKICIAIMLILRS